MATKPNETYKWGENATQEQVAAYEDTGWPSDIIPPKRTQFNWYQNLVGKWLGWAEDAVDELVDTVLDAWFVEVAGHLSVPNKTGVYKHDGHPRFYMVYGGQMTTVGFIGSSFSVSNYTWTGSMWSSSTTFARSNTRTSILQESEANYVTPKGLVDYFSVKGTPYLAPQAVPHQTGVYLIGAAGSLVGVSVVIGDSQVYMQTNSGGPSSAEYDWDGSAWVQQ